MVRQKDSNVVEIQLAVWREQMLSRLLPLTSAIATVGVIIGVISVIERDMEIYIPIYVGAWILLMLITFVRRLAYHTRAIVLLALITILGVTILSESGLYGDGRSFLIVLPVAAIVLLDWKYSLIAMVLSVAILLLFGYLGLPLQSHVKPSGFIDWLLSATLATMLVTAIIISLRAILDNLMATLEQELRARQELREISDHWEKTVNRRTEELERRDDLIMVYREIIKSLNRQPDSNRLLQDLTTFINKVFEIDHISIFILEADGELANLRAATGSATERWLAEGRAARAGDHSLVGWCMQHGKNRLVTAQDDKIPPVIPKSESALGLPMRIGDKISGVLVLQTEEAAVFDQDATDFWQKVADEIALAIELTDRHQAGQSERQFVSGPRAAGAPRFALQMREALDVESVIKTAAREIGETLSLAAVDIYLGSPPSSPDSASDPEHADDRQSNSRLGAKTLPNPSATRQAD